MIVNVFTVDVEEYYHAAIFRRGTNGLSALTLESRVERSMDHLLDLLRRHQTRATFFVQNTERQYLELGFGPKASILTLSVAGKTEQPRKRRLPA